MDLPPLPSWQEIRVARPDLAERLRVNRRDFDAIVEYAVLTFGAEIVSDTRRKAA